MNPTNATPATTPATTPAQMYRNWYEKLKVGIPAAELPRTASADDELGCALVILGDAAESLEDAYSIGDIVAVLRVGMEGVMPEVTGVGVVHRIAVTLIGDTRVPSVVLEVRYGNGEVVPYALTDSVAELQSFIIPLRPEQNASLLALANNLPAGCRVRILHDEDAEEFGTVRFIGLHHPEQRQCLMLGVQADGEETIREYVGSYFQDFTKFIQAIEMPPNVEYIAPPSAPANGSVFSYRLTAYDEAGKTIYSAAAWSPDAARDLFLNGDGGLDGMFGQTAASVVSVKVLRTEHFPNGETRRDEEHEVPAIRKAFCSMMAGRIEAWKDLVMKFNAFTVEPTEAHAAALHAETANYQVHFHALPFPNPFTVHQGAKSSEGKAE